jgi:hypothetical protein
METTTSSIKSENGISKVIINKNTPLYAYEQWSANHKLGDDVRKRKLFPLTWEEAIKNKKTYEDKSSDSFTPTVFIEINNIQYLGVVNDIKPVDQSDEHKELKNLNQTILVELTIDTSIMQMRDSSGTVTSLPSLPNISEETNIFMNIDEQTNIEELSINNFNQNQIEANQVLTIDNEVLELNNDFVNYGTIKLNGYYINSNDKPNSFLKIDTQLINHGIIKIEARTIIKTVDYYLHYFINGGFLNNMSDGAIYIGDLDDLKGVVIENNNNSTKQDFCFINSEVNNSGKIIFSSLRNLSNYTAIGINTLASNEGTIIFQSIISACSKTTLSDSINNTENIMIGIKKCYYNQGNIVFGDIINGLDHVRGTEFTQSNTSIGGASQQAIGIKYMGAVDITTKRNPIDFKLTNPLYNNYGIMGQVLNPDEVNPDENEETSNILGCGENSVIFINKIVNNSLSRNSSSLYGACGIYNLIQTDNSAIVQINSIDNIGYGGETACCGIMNVLVNYGNININRVSNECLLDNDGYKESKCYGIHKVVQNGYTKPEREFLPPFPPADYSSSTLPHANNKTQDLKIDESYIKSLGIDYRIISMNYKQGHISIHKVITHSLKNNLTIGIGQYGGLSFNNKIMEDGTNTPIDITLYMQKYVHKYTPLSIVWSYPTDKNTEWRTEKSRYLEESFPETDDYGYLSITELHSELKRIGWYWDFSNPVQMYYKYEKNTDVVTDSIFFPINWGIVNIDYVITGGENGLETDDRIQGSAYGIDKAISSFGPIQINIIESNIKQHYLSITTNETTLINTNDQPEISALFFENNEDAEFIDMPVKYLQNQQITEVYGNSINDLPITITMESADIANPEDRIDGIWTTGTNSQLNFCWPYHIANKEQHNEGFIHKDHNNLEDEFKLPGNDYMDFPASNPASTLLEAMSSPGAAFGVYRTIDYSSGAAGLCFMKAFTQKIENVLEPTPWNNSDVYTAPWRIYTAFDQYARSGNADAQKYRNTKNTIDYNQSYIKRMYGLEQSVPFETSNEEPITDFLTPLGPMPKTMLDKNRMFHWQVVRQPQTQDPPFFASDYVHYPFINSTENSKNITGIGAYAPPGFDNALDDKNNPWKKWGVRESISIPRGRGTREISSGVSNSIELQELLEKPLTISIFSKWINGVDIKTHFDDPTQNSTLYIYNSTLLKEKLSKKYYKNIYISDSDYQDPSPENTFNGLVPFPILDNVGPIGQFSNLSYYTRTFQGSNPIPEKILWNPSSYRFQSEIQSQMLSFRVSNSDINPGPPPGLYTHNNWYKGTIEVSGSFGSCNTCGYSIDVGGYGDWRGRIEHNDWLRPTDKNRAIIHDKMLIEGIYNGKENIPTDRYTRSVNTGNFFNLLKSSWPYSSAVKELTDFYYGTDELSLSDSGKTGPVNSMFFCSTRKNDDIRNLSDILSYNYTPTRPIGFNPQLIQGGLFKIEKQHPSYDDVIRENGDARCFSVISSGHNFINSLTKIDHESITQPTFENNILTHETEFFNKYSTNNRYYGFIYENRNPRVKLIYNVSEMISGSFSRYKNILDMVNNLIYINAKDENEYTEQYAKYQRQQSQKKEQEEQRKQQMSESFWGNTFVMLLIPLLLAPLGL